MCFSITRKKEQPGKTKNSWSQDTAMPKNQQQPHIIQLGVKQLAKSEKFPVRTAFFINI